MWEEGLPSSPVQFSSHCYFYKLSCSWLLGGAAAPASCHVCLQLTWKWVFPSLLWSFLPSTSLTSFPTPGYWERDPAPTGASPAARLVYLQFREGFPSPNIWCSVHSTLFPMCLYCSYCLLVSFSFFPGWGQSVQGAMLLWPRVVCGSTAVPQSSPCPHLLKPSGRV
jgi:hypothetical protein